MSTHDFYRDLAEMSSFRDVADPSVYDAVPDDWYVIVTDVRSSTKAIEAGKYKEVNVLGAACIVTVLNACRDRDLPFVFGGDGATLLVTANELDRATQALLGLAATAERVLGMDLRVGVVPVHEITAAGHSLGVAKLALSGEITLAMFWGTGMGFAEDLVKGTQTEARYTLKPGAGAAHPDVSGLECRWRPIATRNGTMASIIVLAQSDEPTERAKTYVRVLDEFEKICPGEQARPVQKQEQLLLSRGAEAFEAETRIRVGEKSGLRHFARSAYTQFETRVGEFLMQKGTNFGGFDGAQYPAALIAHTDFRKFDDTLRMVVDLTPDQLAQFEKVLSEMHESGDVFYGVHEANAAMMTCLVWDRQRDHLHFVDGADGGYALAAKQLKAQLRA